jgi:DNA polymerase/3'-5' exonuclease PolX
MISIANGKIIDLEKKLTSTNMDSSQEIKYLKDRTKLIDNLEVDIKKVAMMKANQTTVEKLQDKLYYQTPNLKQFEELKSFSEKNIDKIQENFKNFKKKMDRFKIDQDRLNERIENRLKDMDETIENVETKVI